ncbi:WXG100 family type VII secretion target [Nocardioides sp.]|uniref:WXG100 family type VII secretion target n=1 Tax=Nocardioides sp. TaxID=35761 RepID=UPI003564F33A
MTNNQMMAGEGTLARAAEMVAAAKIDLDQLSNNLSSRLLSAQSQWQGAGGSAFFTLHQAWNQKQRSILAALHEFESGLRRTQQHNLATDDAAQAAQRTVLHRLDGVRR